MNYYFYVTVLSGTHFSSTDTNENIDYGEEMR